MSRNLTYDYEVRDSNGNPVGPPKKSSDQLEPGDGSGVLIIGTKDMVLQPGESRIDYVPLESWFEISRPGTYTFRYRRTLRMIQHPMWSNRRSLPSQCFQRRASRQQRASHRKRTSGQRTRRRPRQMRRSRPSAGGHLPGWRIFGGLGLHPQLNDDRSPAHTGRNARVGRPPDIQKQLGKPTAPESLP